MITAIQPALPHTRGGWFKRTLTTLNTHRLLMAHERLRQIVIGLTIAICVEAGAHTPTYAQDADATGVEQSIAAIVAERDIQPATRQQSLEAAARLGRAQTALEAAIPALETRKAELDARLEQLGPPDPAAPEAEAVAEERRRLTSALTEIDSGLRRGRAAIIEADQERKAIAAAEAQTVEREREARVGSPLLPRFWADAAAEAPAVLRRFREPMTATVGRIAESSPGVIALLVAGLLSGALIAGPLRHALHRLGLRFAASRSPDSRLRRSAFAAWSVALGSLVPVIGVVVMAVAVLASKVLDFRLALLFTAIAGSALMAAYIWALTDSLLLVRKPEWRLLALDDGAARRLRPLGWAAGGILITSAVNGAFGALFTYPPALASAMSAIVAAMSTAWLFWMLLVVGRLRSAAPGGDTTGGLVGRWVALGLMVLWPLTIVVAVRGALGYVSFATTTTQWVIWTAIVVATVYLLTRLIDDACRAAFGGAPRLSRSAHARFGVADRAVLQFGVLISAGLRVVLWSLALGALFSPFGGQVEGLFDLFRRFGAGLSLGEVTLSPAALARAGVVLACGLALGRLFRHWLAKSYLPTTSLDSGAANSVGIIAGYASVILAALAALAALGIQFQQLAFIVSALSVGIGFGLQAITQNFVSGLILLAERPLKIGDRLKMGDQAGVVTRISVRATQILTDAGDRLIVPNSELVTKPVQAVSSAIAPATIRAAVAVDIAADLEAARTTIVEVLSNHAEADPSIAPSVFIDDLRDGLANFTWVAYPRPGADPEQTRGALWLAIIGAMRSAGIRIQEPLHRVAFLAGNTEGLIEDTTSKSQ